MGFLTTMAFLALFFFAITSYGGLGAREVQGLATKLVPFRSEHRRLMVNTNLQRSIGAHRNAKANGDKIKKEKRGNEIQCRKLKKANGGKLPDVYRDQSGRRSNGRSTTRPRFGKTKSRRLATLTRRFQEQTAEAVELLDSGRRRRA